MTNDSIYQQLAEMIAQEDEVGMPVMPSLVKILSLQFMPDEAALALKVRIAGGTLSELAERTTLDPAILKTKLLKMADHGTIVYDPAAEDPVYRVTGMVAGGLTETGLWGGIRFPYTVALGKAITTLMKDHAETALAKLGFGYTPVWAAQAALPKDASLSENLAEVIREAGHWSVSPCPCRFSHGLVESKDACNHMMETCMHTGALSRWAVRHGMARELTYEQALDQLRLCNEDGLVHTINIYGQICNCCNHSCAIFHTFKMGVPTFIPSPFTARTNPERCNTCAECSGRCPVNAIQVDGHTMVDAAACIGCGVCVPSCPTKAMSLVRRG